VLPPASSLATHRNTLSLAVRQGLLLLIKVGQSDPSTFFLLERLLRVSRGDWSKESISGVMFYASARSIDLDQLKHTGQIATTSEHCLYQRAHFAFPEML
jgi:hypothetical protein